jgi:hypothetical protein
MQDWGKGVELLLIRPRIELERPERRGVENVAQQDDSAQPNDGQPPENE